MPSTPPLCTLEQVKTQLGITDTSSDGVINQLIPAVSAEILNEINRLDLLPNTDFEEWRCGDGRCKLYTKHYPITEITSINVNGDAVPEWDAANPSVSGWRFVTDPNPENQQFILLVGSPLPALGYPFSPYGYPVAEYCWPVCYTPNILIQYKAGYQTVPPALQQAAVDFIAFKRSMALIQASDPTVSSRQMGDYSEQLGAGRVIIDYLGIDIPQSVKAVIDQYKRIVV